MGSKYVSDAYRLENLVRQMKLTIDRCGTEGARKALRSAIAAIERETKELRKRGEYE